MKILVTGGYGFIGREVVRQLADRGDEVVAMGRTAEPLFKIPHVYNFKGDVSKAEDVRKVFEEHRVDKVIHLGYAMDIWGNHPRSTIDVNVTGFVNILEACLQYSIKRLVWSSSVMVYGRPNEYESSVDENVRTNPNTFYGKCKQFDEYLAGHYSDLFGLDQICLRPTTVYGPGRYARGAATFLYDCVYAAVTGERVHVEFGLAKTDLVHVRDVARACLLALDIKESPYRIFNISGYEISARQLVQLLEKLLNKPVNVSLAPKEDNRFPSKINRDLAKTVLGYEPEISLEEGLKEYLVHFDPKAPLQR